MPAKDVILGAQARKHMARGVDTLAKSVGVTLGPDRSLLVADDVGNVIWRVTAA